MPHQKTNMSIQEWGYLLFLSLIWGGSFFFAEVALVEVAPLTIVLVRVYIAALFLNMVVISRGHRMPRDRHLWQQFFAMGLLNNLIPFSLIFIGQTQIPGGLASILNAATPFWAVLIAHFLTSDEKLRANRLLGVVLGIGGVIYIVGPDVLQGVSGTVWGQLAVVAATISYAFAGVYGKRFREIPPLITAAGQVTATTIMMTPIALWVDRPWERVPTLPATWWALLGLGVISTGVAYIIYFRLLTRVGATNLMLVTLLIPVSALGLGVLFLNEEIRSAQIIGLAIIIVGLVLIDGRLWPKAN